jgi:para-nitrobenzyl esterase
VVTLNYRLGPLGSFAHPALVKAAAPNEPFANYALMDSVEGLRWIGRSIARFRGDPDNVTVFGQAAGDFMVDGTPNHVPLIIGSNSGERGFNGARTVATAMSAKAPVFLYQFAYVPEWRKAEQPAGAPHSAEIVYVFDSWDTTSLRTVGVQPVDREVAQRVHSCWVAFAKAPVDAKSLSCADGFTWPAFDAAGDQAARFDATPKVVSAKDLPDGPAPGAPRGSMAPN